MVDPGAPPFTSYQPAQYPGYYHFAPADGGAPMLFGGDEARRMAGLIDSRPQADQRQAMNLPAGPMPGADPSLAGSIAGMHEAEQNDAMRRQLTPQGPAPTHAAEAPSADLSTPSMPAMAPPAATVAAPAQPMGFGPAAEGPPAPEARSPDHRVFSTQPPPIDQLQPSYRGPPGGGPEAPSYQQLPASTGAGKAGFRPTTRTVEEEGGIADPETAKLVRNAYDDSLRATNAEERNMTQYLGTQLEQNDQRAKQAAVDAQKAQDQIERAQAVKVAAKKEYDQHIQYAQDDLDKESKREVDQYRMFKGKPGAAITSSLAILLGGIGAGLSGSNQNQALEVVNKQIDNDIQAQRDEILRGVANKQNDLRRIREQYGVDTDEAANILNVALTQKVQAIAAAQAAQAGNQNATQALVQLDGAMAQRRLNTTKDMATIMLVKHKETSTDKYQQAGGYDPLAAAKRQDEYDTLQLRKRLRGEHPEWTEGQIRAGIKAGAGAGSPQAAAAAATIASIDANAPILGLASDPANPSRVIVADADKTPTGKLGRAAQWLGEAAGTEESQQKQQAFRDIARAASMTGRGQVNHDLYEENSKLLHSANSPEMLARIVTDLKRKAVVMHGEQARQSAGGGGYSEGTYEPDATDAEPGDATAEGSE